MSTHALSRQQFNIQHHGPWYHGAGRSDYKSLDGGAARYNMPNYLHGHTYVTQDRAMAEEYAHTSAKQEEETHFKEHGWDSELPKTIQPTVYEAHPYSRHSWEPDPHGGMSGWNDGPTRREQIEQLREGSNESEQVGLQNPVRIKDREILESE